MDKEIQEKRLENGVIERTSRSINTDTSYVTTDGRTHWSQMKASQHQYEIDTAHIVKTLIKYGDDEWYLVRDASQAKALWAHLHRAGDWPYGSQHIEDIPEFHNVYPHWVNVTSIGDGDETHDDWLVLELVDLDNMIGTMCGTKQFMSK